MLNEFIGYNEQNLVGKQWIHSSYEQGISELTIFL